jgi:UDP-3-O-acyl-N-acetylglucosamine deacetylase
VLDLIGDLSLMGKRLYANVTGVKTSHSLNIALTDKIARPSRTQPGRRWQGG